MMYVKPKVEKVKLVVEEAVLTFCKDLLGHNPNKTQGQCNHGVWCYVHGS